MHINKARVWTKTQSLNTQKKCLPLFCKFRWPFTNTLQYNLNLLLRAQSVLGRLPGRTEKEEKKLPTPIIVTFAAIWTIVLEKGWADCSLLFRRFRWQKGTGVLETHSTVHLSLNVTLRKPQGITHKYEPGVRIYAIIRHARYWGQPQNEFTPVPCSPTAHPHTQHVFIINSLSKY